MHVNLLLTNHDVAAEGCLHHQWDLVLRLVQLNDAGLDRHLPRVDVLLTAGDRESETAQHLLKHWLGGDLELVWELHKQQLGSGDVEAAEDETSIHVDFDGHALFHVDFLLVTFGAVVIDVTFCYFHSPVLQRHLGIAEVQSLGVERWSLACVTGKELWMLFQTIVVHQFHKFNIFSIHFGRVLIKVWLSSYNFTTASVRITRATV